jgi:hypothetical protein
MYTSIIRNTDNRCHEELVFMGLLRFRTSLSGFREIVILFDGGEGG